MVTLHTILLYSTPYLLQDMGPFRRMTANLHMLVAHVPKWVR